VQELLPDGGAWTKGRWRPWIASVFPGPVFKQTVALVCPKCDHLLSLVNHTITADGQVSPSVVCPHKCGWHEFIRLKQAS